MDCAVSGTFDPITKGHLDIIQRSACIFDRVYVLVSKTSSKANASLTYEDKIDIINKALSELSANGHPLDYEIVPIYGTLIDTMRNIGVHVIVRGLRNGTDLIYEMDMSSVNRDLDGRIETVYLPCKSELSYVSSSMVRELCKLGKYLEARRYTSKHAVDKIHRRQMKLVALTGGIACGKSEVQKVFEENGWFGIDLDEISHEVLSARAFEIVDHLNKWYGAEISIKDSHLLVKQKIAKLLFSNPDAKKWIEGYLHPQIERLMWKEIYSTNSNKVVVQVPLLFETGMDKLFDATVCVYASENEQIRRMVTYRNMTVEDAKARIANQMPTDLKTSKADFVIDNSGNIDGLRERALKCIKSLDA